MTEKHIPVDADADDIDFSKLREEIIGLIGKENAGHIAFTEAIDGQLYIRVPDKKGVEMQALAVKEYIESHYPRR